MNPPGHESHGVHLCHKCGWPFPKPHPSSKHRRAHKKICGTIEGYKLTHLSVSDDEHLSDDDQKTPSPKVLKRGISGSGSGGVLERSDRSGDDVFSDAVTEFSDTGASSGVEEVLADAGESISTVVYSTEDDKGVAQSVKDSVVSDIIQPSHKTTDGNQMQSLENSESVFVQLRSTTLPLDHVHAKLSDSGAEEPVVDVNDDENIPSHDIHAIDLKTSTDVPEEDNKSNVAEDLTECASISTGLETAMKGNEEVHQEGNEEQIAVSPSGRENRASEVIYALEETNGHNSVPITTESSRYTSVPQTLEKNVGSGSEKLLADFSPQVGSVVEVCEKVDTPRVNEDAIQELKVEGENVRLRSEALQGDLSPKVGSVTGPDANVDTSSPTDVIDSGNTNYDVHVLSISDDLWVVDQPDIMLQGFKGHEALKLNEPVTMDSCVPVKDTDIKGSFSEDSGASSHSKQSAEGIGDSLSIDFNLEVGMGKLEIEQASIEHEADSHVIKGKASDDLLLDEHGGGLTDTVGTDIEKNYTLSPRESQESLDDLSKENMPENATMVLSNVNYKVSSLGPDVDLAENSHFGDDAGDRKKAEKGAIFDDGCRKESGEERHKDNTNTAPESADSPRGSLSGNVTNLDGSDNLGDTSGVVGYEITERSMEENLALTEKAAPEFGRSVSESNAAEGGIEESVCNLTKDDLMHTDSSISGKNGDANLVLETLSNLNRHGKDAEEALELESNRISKVEVEHAAAVDTVAEVKHTDVEFLDKTEGKQLIEKPTISPKAAESSSQSLSRVEGQHIRVLDGGNLGTGSESLQGEDDGNLSKQQPVVSAVDVSVDSSSQNDSVDGNWGSMSDAPEDQKTFKKPKDMSEGSENFEAPSFMTLIEPKDQNVDAVASETEKDRASAQAGWFPSLTNVTNDSQGRKKNIDVIAKVTNWSPAKHTNLKNLLGEASLETKIKSPNTKGIPGPVAQKDGVTSKNGAVGTTANSILGNEEMKIQDTKKEMAKEWNSPARYPAEIKREKKKVKGRPYWVPFVCCSSVN